MSKDKKLCQKLKNYGKGLKIMWQRLKNYVFQKMKVKKLCRKLKNYVKS